MSSLVLCLPEPSAILGDTGVPDTQRHQHPDLAVGWSPPGAASGEPEERAASHLLFKSSIQRAPSRAKQHRCLARGRSETYISCAFSIASSAAALLQQQKDDF